MARIGELVVEHHRASGEVLVDEAEIATAWSELRPDEPLPTDPFDGLNYGFDPIEGGLRIYSSGPDGAPSTEDDLVHEVEVPAAGG